ncbi:uncharacterized protein [Palaemon carinicauda]|uniref:uncharacterized protein n=1 Tax=Palaemon carinicauda TaxID=392227 RepID=UPI0035B57915
MWTVLIQCRLVGKAMRVYNALEGGVARDYQKVKASILKSYDLVPEIYRLWFCNYMKHPAQSFVEFALVKREQFNDWLKSRQIVSFAALRELLLLEEFKKACSRELRVHLEEVKSVKLSSATQLPDEFVLNHPSGDRDVGRVQGGPPPPKAFTNRDFPGVGNKRYNGNSVGPEGSCFRCKKPAHFQNQCNARRIYLQRNNQSPVKFFSGTGSDRSLVLKRALNGFEKHTRNFVLLGGFQDSVVSAPLVNVRMSFPRYVRITELGVVDSLPIPGIDSILGNDMMDSERRELFPIISVNTSPVAVMTRFGAKAANLLDVESDDALMLVSVELDVLRTQASRE